MALRWRRRRPLSIRSDFSDQSDWDDWPDGVTRRILPQTDSTNAEAQRSASLLAGPEWILALHQTAARGRRGRPWAMLPGNFAATYVMRPPEPPAVFALRSFVAALALFDAFVAVTGRPDPFALKWPNDVLLSGGKVAGILLESFMVAGNPHLAIGFGVNLATAPERGAVEARALRPVSLASETGMLLSPADFLAALGPAYAIWEQRFTSYGFAPIREAWLNRAARIGTTITVRTGTQATTGTFETIDTTGALVLATDQGRQAIPAADIYF